MCSWELGKGLATAVDAQSHSNQVVGFAPGQGRTYSAGWDDMLHAIDESSPALDGAKAKLDAQPKDLSASNGRVYVATASGVAVYENDRLLKETALPFAPTAIAAHEPHVAVGADQKVLIYETDAAGSLRETHTLTKSTSQISSLSFSPDGAHLAAGNAVGKIVVYKSDGSWEVATDRWSAHTARVTCVAWNDEGTHAASGALDTNVHVWSLAKPGSRIKAGNAHKDGVNGVVWVGGQVVSSGGDAAVKVWDVKLQ
ncbi:WD40 repeat domain-containing protein [Candidatus Bathyarchaeota archaeon]|nr:WD40 repeat domain-containing protein [Candidatus Bathyarchaeota archaeon]